jgi:hypothetical protein
VARNICLVQAGQSQAKRHHFALSLPWHSGKKHGIRGIHQKNKSSVNVQMGTPYAASLE